MFHFLRVALLAFVLFLALSFFGISIEKVIESPAGQANLAYVSSIGVSLWHWLVGYINQLFAQFQTVRL